MFNWSCGVTSPSYKFSQSLRIVCSRRGDYLFQTRAELAVVCSDHLADAYQYFYERPERPSLLIVAALPLSRVDKPLPIK